MLRVPDLHGCLQVMHTTSVFTASNYRVCGLDYIFFLRKEARRLVSTPSPKGAWLGIIFLQFVLEMKTSPNLTSALSRLLGEGPKIEPVEVLLLQPALCIIRSIIEKIKIS